MTGDGRLDLPLDRLPLLLQPFHSGQLGRPGVELLLALNACRVQQVRGARPAGDGLGMFDLLPPMLPDLGPQRVARATKSDCCSSSRRTISRICSVACDDESLTSVCAASWRMRPQIASSSRLRC